jgi:hypothetical protein
MLSKFVGVMTGLALLASVGVANAGQRATLTDAQLDRIAAGVSFASVNASVEGLSANLSAFLSASNTSATVGSASASATLFNITVVGIAPHTASLSTFASAP